MQDDDDIGYHAGSGSYRVPDKDVYRRTISTFGSVATYFQSRYTMRSARDRRILQPHYSSWQHILSPFANTLSPGDGICSHFLRRGLIKPNKTQMVRH
jgi:hypothetical protein